MFPKPNQFTKPKFSYKLDSLIKIILLISSQIFFFLKLVIISWIWPICVVYDIEPVLEFLLIWIYKNVQFFSRVTYLSFYIKIICLIINFYIFLFYSKSHQLSCYGQQSTCVCLIYFRYLWFWFDFKWYKQNFLNKI